MKNKNWLYIFYLVVFTVILDFSLGKIYETLYFSDKSSKQDRLIHSAIGTTENVLIFGSSRAYHHYNPTIIQEITGLSCFNVGNSGQNIYFHLAILKSAISRYKPKIVILDIISIDFEKTSSQHDKEKLSVLLPFVNKSEILLETVLKRGRGENIKLLSSTYPFNSMVLHMMRNNYTTIRTDINGYVGLSKIWNEPLEETKIIEVENDPEKIEALFQFIKLCQLNQIDLYIFVSPHFANFKNKSRYSKVSEQLKIKFGIEVIIFEKSPLFLEHPDFFADPYHLNASGANKYTELVSEIIMNKVQIIADTMFKHY